MVEGSPSYLKKYYAEITEQNAKQAELLEELRGFGIVKFLQDASLRKIVPIRPVRYAPYKYSRPKYHHGVREPEGLVMPLDWPTADEFAEALGGNCAGGWTLEKKFPTMDTKGQWNTDLRLAFEKELLEQCSWERTGRAYVNLKYTDSGQLEIVGERTFFSRVISQETLPLETIESSVKQAFRSPKQIEKERTLLRYMPNQRDIIIRATA